LAPPDLAAGRDDRYAAGEILGLRWADVDLDAARLSVRQALVAVGYEVIESAPKSHNARVVDLDAETITQLRAYRRTQQQERLLWGGDYHSATAIPPPE